MFFISTQKDVRGYQKSKINHKNAKKNCQIVLFSSKSTTERPSSSTVVGWFAKRSDTKQWTKNANFCHSMLLTFPYRFKNIFICNCVLKLMQKQISIKWLTCKLLLSILKKINPKLNFGLIFMKNDC